MEPEDDYQNGDDEQGMRPMRKVGRINLIILLVYAGLLLVYSLVAAGGDELGAWSAFVGLAMLAHGAINLAAGVVFFIMRKPEYGKGALVSGLVLLVIGFASCVVAISTMSFH